MRMYLAGVEQRTEQFKEAQPPYILFSFASCQGGGKKKEKIMDCVRSPWCKDFLCDSGAFTYFSKGKSKTLAEWDSYVDEYIDFINAYNIHHFFELDIDRIVGLDKVEEFRRRIEKGTGKQCIPVWHSNRGWAYFERMCAEYGYVSIGGIAKNPNGKAIEKLFPWFIDHAHKTGLRYTVWATPTQRSSNNIRLTPLTLHRGAAVQDTAFHLSTRLREWSARKTSTRTNA